MRRRFVLIFALLVGGAIVNALVAWGLLAAAPVRDFVSDDDVEDWYRFAEHHNLRPPDTRSPFRLRGEWRFEGTGFAVSRVDYIPAIRGIPILGTGSFIVYSEAGFPMRCLHGWVFERGDYCHCIRVDPARVQARAFFVFSSREDACLPLRPIWSGFAVNSTCYATLLWLTVVAPFTLRRALRRRRRLCESCAYPIGVSPVCTECGAAVRGAIITQELTP